MKQKKYLFMTNTAVLLFGMAGLFARLINLPAIEITFARVFFSSMTLFLLSFITKQNIKIKNKKHLLLLIGAGLILAIHWWSFLYAIQISSVAIGTITFSSFPLFIIFLEIVFLHEKLHSKDILFCLLILLGVFITVPAFSLENQSFQGIIKGMISAFSYALLTLMNRYFSNIYSSITISLYEQSSAAVVLLPTLFIIQTVPTLTEIGGLIFLGVVTTALAHTLFISSLKQIPAYLAGIISSLETVYSIVLAIILFQEFPATREILGAIIIITTVIMAQLKYKKT